MSRLLQVFDLEMPLRERLAAGMPTLSTCAGLILMSREVLDGRPDQIALGVLDVSVRRNGYGRQVELFEADLPVSLARSGAVSSRVHSRPAHRARPDPMPKLSPLSAITRLQSCKVRTSVSASTRR